MGKQKIIFSKINFDQLIINIEILSEIFFEEYEKSEIINESSAKEICLYIRQIEDDVLLSLSRCYSKSTIDRMVSDFLWYSMECSWAVSVVNNPKFRYYFEKFKPKACDLKLDAMCTILENDRNNKGAVLDN